MTRGRLFGRWMEYRQTIQIQSTLHRMCLILPKHFLDLNEQLFSIQTIEVICDYKRTPREIMLQTQTWSQLHLAHSYSFEYILFCIRKDIPGKIGIVLWTDTENSNDLTITKNGKIVLHGIFSCLSIHESSIYKHPEYIPTTIKWVRI